MSIIVMLCLLFSLCFSFNSYGDEKTEQYKWGQDNIVIPAQFKLPSKKETDKFNIRTAHYVFNKISIKDLPIREGVQFYKLRDQVWAQEKEDFTPLNAKNIGYFLNKINNGAEFRNLISVLLWYDSFDSTIIPYDIFKKLMKKLKSEKNNLPFVLRDKEIKNINKKLIAKNCFKESNLWHWNFLRVEDVSDISIVEYKFVLNEKNHLGFVRHVLIQGPECPFAQGAALVLLQKKTKEEKLAEEEYLKCRTFIEKIRKSGH